MNEIEITEGRFVGWWWRCRECGDQAGPFFAWTLASDTAVEHERWHQAQHDQRKGVAG